MSASPVDMNEVFIPSLKSLSDSIGVSNTPGLSGVPSVPSMPSMPKTPSVSVAPSLPSVPKTPSISASPSVPSVPSTPTIATASPGQPSIIGTVEKSLTAIPEEVSSWNWGKMVKIIIIIVLLSYIGFNIFKYLARTTEVVGDLSMRLFGTSFRTVSDVVKTTAQTSAIGVGEAVDITGGAIKSAANVVSGAVTGSLQELENAINGEPSSNQRAPPTPDNEDSEIQKQQKGGYCFIGSEKDYRTCSYVGANDKCMSGEVFPTMELCINPNLRA